MSSVLRVALALALAMFVRPAAAAAQAEGWTVYTGVADRTGAAVPGLTSADFTVREDGVPREILRVSPANDTLQIALVIDTSQEIRPDLIDLRQGLRAFLKDLPSRHEVALIGFGGRPTVLVDYTRDASRLDKGIAQLFARPDSGSYLMQTLIETSKGFKKKKLGRPVIVVITAEGPEFSEIHYQIVLDYLRDGGVTLHSYVVSKPGLSLKDKNAESAQELELALALGTRMTGGRREDLSTAMALSPQLQALTLELNNQYQIVYGRPPMLIPPTSIVVGVKRPEWTVHAPRVF